MNKLRAALLGAGILSGLLGLGWVASDQVQASGAKRGSVASMDDHAIDRERLEAALAGLPEAVRLRLKTDSAAGEQWVKRLLVEQALSAEAEKMNFAERADVRRRLEQAYRQILLQAYLDDVGRVDAAYPGEDELRQVYERNKANLRVPAQYRLAQIFLAAPAAQAELVRTVGEQARKLASRAADKADFAALAREFSQDAATAAKGGDSGFVPLGNLVPEVRTVVVGMKPGQVSAPVQSAAGWHVLKLLEATPERTPAFDEIRGELHASLVRQRRLELQQRHVDEKVSKAVFSVDGAALQSILQK